MAQIVVGIIGAAIGSTFGHAKDGFAAGMLLGGILFPEDLGTTDQNKLNDIRIQGASQGTAIPKIFGEYRLAGNIIWASPTYESFTTESMGGGSGQPTGQTRSYHYEGHLDILVAEGPIESIERIFANDVVIYDNTGDDPVWDKNINPENVRIYLGDETQLPDSLIQSIEGSDNTPANRGSAHVVFESFNYDPYGGTPPNFNFHIKGAPCNAEEVANWVCESVELNESEYDFSSVASKEIDGFAVLSRTEGRNVLETASKIFMYRLCEFDGVMQGVECIRDAVGTLEEKYFGCASGITPTGVGIQCNRRQEIELPSRVIINYSARGKDFQSFNQTAIRLGTKSTQELSLSFNAVVTDNYARQLAEIIKQEEWIQRFYGEVTLPWSFMYYTPGDIVNVPTPIGTITMEIVKIAANIFGPLTFSLVAYDKNIYTQTVEGITSNESSTVTNFQGMYHFLGDTNALYDADADSIGFYGGAGSTSVKWPGAQCLSGLGFIAQQGGFGSNVLLTYEEHATMGYALTELGPCSMPEIWDDVNTVDIYLYRGSVETADSELDVLNGKNKIVIGKEIISFKNVEVLSQHTFRLSRLLRGRRGTEYAIEDHAINDIVVIPTTASKRYNTGIQFLNMSLSHRTIEINKHYSELPDLETLLIEGNSRKPYSVCHVTASRDGGNNLTINWIRRVRKNGDLVDYTDAVLDETSEAYDVVIYTSSAYSAIKRTIRVTSPTCNYTAFMQNADFGSVQSTVYAIIYQISDVVGRGFGARIQV